MAPWWAWPAGVALALVVAAPVHGGAGGARAVVPYVVAPLLVLALLTGVSRGRVRLVDGVLTVAASEHRSRCSAPSSP